MPVRRLPHGAAAFALSAATVAMPLSVAGQNLCRRESRLIPFGTRRSFFTLTRRFLVVLRKPRLAALAGIAFAINTPALAQSQNAASVRQSQAFVQRRQLSLDQSVQQFIAGNTPGGEQAVVAGIEQAKGTPSWHEEVGQRLFVVALRLRSERQAAGARSAVDSALRQLDQCVSVATARGNMVVAARAQELAGVVYEHFFGDLRAASARLQESVRLNPAGKSNVREAERLLQAEADLNRRTGRP